MVPQGTLVNVPASFSGGHIHSQLRDDAILEHVSAGRLVVLKNAFPESAMHAIRTGLLEFTKTHPSTNPEVKPGVGHFRRVDINPERSQVKRIVQSFYSFYWGERDISGERPFLLALAGLRNRLAGLREDYAFHGVEDDHLSVPQITHYPVGGGYLQPHVDPPSIQKVVVTAILSRRGVDYESGGLHIEDEAGSSRHMVDDALEPGDVYLMNPAVRHGVAPIDPDKTLNFDSSSGRWMMFSTLIPYASLSGGATPGLKAY